MDVLSSTRLRAVRAALYDGTREDTDTVTESLKNLSEQLVNNNDDLILKYLKFVTFLENSSHNSTRLANILSRVEHVDLQELKLHEDFAFYDEVMRNIAGNSNIKLKSLNITEANLLGVDEEILSLVLNRIEKVEMSRVKILPEQFQAISNDFIDGDSQLKSLNLSRTLNISPDMTTFSQTVCNLVEIVLRGTDRVIDIQTLFLKILETENLTLKRLDVSENSLSHVSPSALVGVVCRLDSVGLAKTNMTGSHLSSLFQTISAEGQLKELDVGGNNLSISVPPNTLATAITRLRIVNLWRTNLSEGHVNSLFKEIVQADNLELRNMNISQNNLSNLTPVEFSRGVRRLEEVTMLRCKLVNTSSTSYGSYSLPPHDSYLQPVCEVAGKLRVLKGNFLLSGQIIERLNMKLHKFCHSFF